MFFVQELGMDPLELVLVGTVLEATVFLFEIPTGVVADTVSRRLSVCVGFAIHGVAALMVATSESFEGVLLGYVAFGIGWTFLSGAAEAWIADESGGKELTDTFFRGAQIRFVGALAGIAVGVSLGTLDLRLPIAAAGFGLLALSFALAAAMPETQFRAADRSGRATWGDLARTFRAGVETVREKSSLLWLFAAAAFAGMYSEGIDRLSDAHYLANFELPTLFDLAPVVWIGCARAGALVVGLGATELARRRLAQSRPGSIRVALLVATAIQWLGTLAFASAGSFAIAFGFAWVIAAGRAAAEPLFDVWVNQRIDSRARATVNSMAGQMDAAGQILGGPILGGIGRAASLRAALAASALVLTPALWLYSRAREAPPHRVS